MLTCARACKMDPLHRPRDGVGAGSGCAISAIVGWGVGWDCGGRVGSKGRGIGLEGGWWINGFQRMDEEPEIGNDMYASTMNGFPGWIKRKGPFRTEDSLVGFPGWCTVGTYLFQGPRRCGLI